MVSVVYACFSANCIQFHMQSNISRPFDKSIVTQRETWMKSFTYCDSLQAHLCCHALCPVQKSGFKKRRWQKNRNQFNNVRHYSGMSLKFH